MVKEMLSNLIGGAEVNENLVKTHVFSRVRLKFKDRVSAEMSTCIA